MVFLGTIKDTLKIRITLQPKNAKEKKIGIWSKIDSVPPWEYRKISR